MTAKQRAIEQEYGEPFVDVVRGFAEMGYSRSDTAAIIGYNAAHFRRAVLPRIDPEMEIPWPSRGRSVAALDAAARRSACRQWRASVTASRRARAIWIEIDGKRMTLADAARLPGVTVAACTIEKRYRLGVRGRGLIAPPMPRAERGRLALKGRRPADNHPWRMDDDMRRLLLPKPAPVDLSALRQADLFTKEVA